MPIDDFEGTTFVAFLDISGFKEMMKQEEKAFRALDILYSSGYNILQNQDNTSNYRVEGLFISDCGVLFVRSNLENNSIQTEGFCLLLEAVKYINNRMMENDFMLTTSIAYGSFKYRNRIEFAGIDKTPIYGDAYASAFIDSEKTAPRIKPGQCRIVRENLPEYITSSINLSKPPAPFDVIRTRNRRIQHFYYYWMVNHPDDINEFEKNYSDAYNLKYSGFLRALKNASV